MVDLFPGEAEPVAHDPILRGVDLALGRLVQRDCFTERTLRILDELRAEVVARPLEHCTSCGIDLQYPTALHLIDCPEPGDSELGGSR